MMWTKTPNNLFQYMYRYYNVKQESIFNTLYRACLYEFVREASTDIISVMSLG